nr:hypothetical protein I308_02771 [Cryptococcus tetragattii IND107]
MTLRSSSCKRPIIWTHGKTLTRRSTLEGRALFCSTVKQQPCQSFRNGETMPWKSPET